MRWGYASARGHAGPEGGTRRTGIFVKCTTKFDPHEINNLGQLGASVVVIPEGAVEQAVSDLLAEWGDIPVQDNSGRYPHLATAPGVLVI